MTDVLQAADNEYFNMLKNHPLYGFKNKIRDVYNAGRTHPMAPTYTKSGTPNPIHPRNVILLALESDAAVKKEVI